MSEETWSFSKLEFLLIISLCFGYSIIGSIHSVLTPPVETPITNTHLQWLIIFEPIVLSICYVLLKSRHFDFSVLAGLGNNVGRHLLRGVGLFLASYLCYYSVYYVVALFFPDTIAAIAGRDLASGDLNKASIILVSIINPFFEESILLGYVVTTLRTRMSKNWCINISIAIRLSYHLYQGPLAVLSILPLGLIFTYWYYKNSTIWPVVVAHGIYDFLGLILI